MSEGDNPGLRMCCCTDAVVAPGLGNDAEMFFGPLALWQTEEEGKNSAESLPRERELQLHLGLHLGRSGSPFCFSPDPFLKPVSLPVFISLSKKRRLES